MDFRGRGKNMNEFKTYHPIVNFTYFTFVLLFSMFFMHPVCLGISLACSFTYSVLLNGRRAVRFNFLYMLPLLIISALINPAFNHEGMTVLAYLPSGNPLTLESIAYGLAAATMIVTVICWFSCYNTIMTSDKFIYLFGKMIPSLSLILSMSLRFVPRFKAQARVISDAQRCVGRDISSGSLLQRTKHGITILSILVTWALENAIETADSMKSRGYGLPGRTAFSLFIFDKRDQKALACILLLGLYIIAGYFSGSIYFDYFPSMKGATASFFSISLYAAYFILCMIPVIIELWEAQKWKALKSKI